MYRTAQYEIVNEKRIPEVVHYETSAEQVFLFDEAMKKIGTLQGVLNGKDMGQTEVDISTIKHSNSFVVKKMKDAPKVIDKILILQSTAVGKLGAPDFVHFTATYPSGEVFNNTVVGSKSSGWSSGGQALKESLDKTNKKVEENETKIAANKTNLDLLKKSHDELSDSYGKHNHDSTYLKLSGGTVTGDIGLQHGGSFKFVSSQGETKNFANYSVAEGSVLGDTSTKMDIKSSGNLTNNGKRIWTESNHGKGSGLDADKIQGVSGNDIAQLNRVNRFREDVYVDSGKATFFRGSGLSGGVYWQNDNGSTRSSIRSGSDGSIIFYGQGGSSNARIDGGGNILSSKMIGFDCSVNENKILYQLNKSDKGMGMYRNKNSQYLGFYDWNRSKRLGYFDHKGGHLHLDESPAIKGRRLHLQGSTPSGSHKVGDIWIS